MSESLQVVVADAAAVRVAAAGTGFPDAELGLFGRDMLRPVPLSRWDSDDHRHLFLGNRPPVRFGGFMTGANPAIYRPRWRSRRVTFSHSTGKLSSVICLS